METVNSEITKNIPKIESFSINSIFTNKYYTIIIIVVVVIITYFLYKQKIFDRFLKNKNELNKEIKDDTKNYIDLDKDYYILDIDNNPIKLNLKEMIVLHKQFLEQQYIQHMYQQKQQQEQQEQQQEQQKVKQTKLKHPKIEEETEENNSEDDLNLEEIENLKKELEDIKKKNQILNQ
jgi:hypothetical protein